MNLTVIDPSEKAQRLQWDLFVQRQPLASGYHLMAWRHVIQTVFNHPTYYLMATSDQGEVVGVLPLVLLRSRLFGRFLVSLPYFNYGGVLATDMHARKELLKAAENCAQELHASHIELRQTADVSIAWPQKDHKVSMRLELPLHYDDLLRGFTPKLRSQVRRGEKEGMTVHTGGLDLLNEFYAVFSLNMRDLGTPVYGKPFFAEILKVFPKVTAIVVVRLKGNPVAAGFVYGFRHTLEIPWASSDRRYARLAPNMMLYGAVLRHACEQGYRVFDFGRSSKDSGTYRFKEQWGAKPVQLHWYYWLRDGKSHPELNPQNPKYRFAIEVWKRLPLPLTAILGPRISKYLP